MRAITFIVLHCTATQQSASIESIKNYWKNNLKWQSPGYHFIIKPDGEIVSLWPIEKTSNGVAGFNANSIHISYVGGVDKKGNALDNRTEHQIASMIKLVKEMKAKFPNAKVLGHRDFKGVVKACPSFDVSAWLKSVGL